MFFENISQFYRFCRLLVQGDHKILVIPKHITEETLLRAVKKVNTHRKEAGGITFCTNSNGEIHIFCV